MNEPTSREVHETAAELFRKGRIAEAHDLVRTGLLQFPQDGRLIELQGIFWHLEGRIAGGRWALELASTLVPLSAPAQYLLADSYRREGRIAEARCWLDWLAEQPDLDGNLIPSVAALFGRLGDDRSALALCRRVIERDSDCDEALFGAAFYMRRLGFPPQAAAGLLRRAVRLEPGCCLYRRTLASLLAVMGEIHEAYALYCTVDLERICCAKCLETMAYVFERSGDEERREAVVRRAEEMTRQAAGREPARAEAPIPKGE